MINGSAIIQITAITLLSFSLGMSAYAAPASDVSLDMTPATNTTSSTTANALVAGKVVWVKGIFKAMSPDMKVRTLNKADIIYLHDTLTTDTSTEAQIVFTDDTLMTFKPDTAFYISDYAYDKTKATSKGSVGTYVVNLIKGGFRTITGLIAKANPNDYRVNTPVATIGVRGTDYAVYLKNGELFVGYYAGSPCVSNLNQTVCLSRGAAYAKVPSAKAAPVVLTEQPAVFQEKPVITNTTFTNVTSTTPATSITPGPDNMTLPGGDGGVLSSFCIQ